ncbi:RdgB/HAM1 family non-canonical purine NTP pyrophosphatase [bacterium]|nr:RdgB/HAM1 family non-canonical purine NTP pyrophosphatase [bacterium]
MEQIVLATSNPHKVEEINAIVDGIEFILPPAGFDPIENGKTFEENSLIKAKEANRLTGKITLADDSGLCVEYLDGEPGIHSARYAPSAQERIDKLLNVMKDAKNRKAKFVCVMTLLGTDGKVLTQVRGECHGKIDVLQKGKNGFGYDPIFIVDGYNQTMAELSEEEKNKISHRAMALNGIIEFLKK